MVVLKCDNHGTPTVWCDPCLVPLITALNNGGIKTTASCCGHNGKGSSNEELNALGWIMLDDGRYLVIHQDQPDF